MPDLAKLVLQRQAKRIERAASRTRGVRRITGSLARSYYSVVTKRPRGYRVVVDSRSFKGSIIEGGAVAHVIRARKAKALRIGDRFISGPVQHPGIKAHHIVRDAVQQNLARLGLAATRAVGLVALEKISRVIPRVSRIRL